MRENLYRSADARNLPNGAESKVFHRSNFADQTKVIHTANSYADFIVELACERGIPAKERECTGKGKQERVPSSEIQRTPEGRYVISATYAPMQRHTLEDLERLQRELVDIMRDVQEDKMMMTQFRGWYPRNQARNKEAMERCFHSPQLPKLQYSEALHKLSKDLTRFFRVGAEKNFMMILLKLCESHQVSFINFGWTRSHRTQVGLCSACKWKRRPRQ